MIPAQETAYFIQPGPIGRLGVTFGVRSRFTLGVIIVGMDRMDPCTQITGAFYRGTADISPAFYHFLYVDSPMLLV